MQGFFTREEQRRGGRPQKKTTSKVAAEYWHKMGLRGVKDFNPDARCPNMEPTGSVRPRIYVLGEAPGKDEDERGVQFIGKSGQLLRSAMPQGYKKLTRWNNVVRTHPKGNKTPEFREIECFRPSLIADIEASKPEIILGVGMVPMAWALGSSVGTITVCRGRRFPVKIGSHSCWFIPTLHPAFLLRNQDRSLEEAFRRDVRGAFDPLPHLQAPPIESWEESLTGVEPVLTWKAVKRLFLELESKPRVAFDIETYPLRPYSETTDLLAISFCWGETTYALPLDHSEAPWSPGEKEEIRKLIKWWLHNGKKKVAHNAGFEMEWMAKLFGLGSIYASPWECTQAQAYTLDERAGGLNLDFCCREKLGVPLKSLVPVNRSGDLGSEPMDRLLHYNGLDAKFTFRLDKVQRGRIKAEGLEKIYGAQLDRIPALVVAQHRGVKVSQKAVKGIHKTLFKEIDEKTTLIQEMQEVRRYRKRVGAFNPDSTKDVGKLLSVICGLELPGTAEDILGPLRDEHPIIDAILSHREAVKLRGYVEALDARNEDCVVWPDGRLHTSYKSMGTVSGRLSSADPNLQNFPKRKHAEVRQVVVPSSPKHTLVAVDYGQIEARVIAMASKDKFLVKALWEGYDIHMEWTDRIAELAPEILEEKHKGDRKKMRTAIKNEFTFPLFYGASPRSVAGYIGISEHLGNRIAREFWSTFAGVKQWQEGLKRAFARDGYVESLTGRRKRAPLSVSMLFNIPIQGAASDIVVGAMGRLAKMAVERDAIWLAPVLNIHDDLTFDIPDEELEGALEIIVSTMLETEPHPFINVPLTVEMSTGKNWWQMKELGTFSSN